VAKVLELKVAHLGVADGLLERVAQGRLGYRLALADKRPLVGIGHPPVLGPQNL